MLSRETEKPVAAHDSGRQPRAFTPGTVLGHSETVGLCVRLERTLTANVAGVRCSLALAQDAVSSRTRNLTQQRKGKRTTGSGRPLNTKAEGWEYNAESRECNSTRLRRSGHLEDSGHG